MMGQRDAPPEFDQVAHQEPCYTEGQVATVADTSQQSPSTGDIPNERNRGAEWYRCDLHVHSGYDRKNFTDQSITGDAHAFQQARRSKTSTS